ncbi:TetR/AcrR family transcriptional regulator [Deinococcus sp.]|uniref:TetR/AcrR family transcriptional regulator n=1 Tax=Deinococcus sp. TaxID=47478 RepID=UPI002869D971|nr:TetR/AcrR family transcriptional regulator [Deinococcus sp.]
MTTPSTDRGRSSRARIVDAACDLFYERGVAATGLNDVVSASGTGKGQLYHYFQDKPDLVLAVVHAQVERTMQPQQSPLDQMRHADDLRAWANQAVLAHSGGQPARCPLGALVSEVADHHDGLRHALDEGFTRWRSVLTIGLTRLQQRGIARTDREADDLAEVLLCAYEGGVLMSEVRGHTAPLRLALDAALEVVLEGSGVPG